MVLHLREVSLNLQRHLLSSNRRLSQKKDEQQEIECKGKLVYKRNNHITVKLITS